MMGGGGKKRKKNMITMITNMNTNAPYILRLLDEIDDFPVEPREYYLDALASYPHRVLILTSDSLMPDSIISPATIDACISS